MSYGCFRFFDSFVQPAFCSSYENLNIPTKILCNIFNYKLINLVKIECYIYDFILVFFTS